MSSGFLGISFPLYPVGRYRKRRVDFLLGIVAGLWLINSITHFISLPPLLGSRGLSWWVLPCCCSAVLLTSEQAVAASSAALRRCSFDAPSSRSPASQQQGSTHQLNPLLPSSGGKLIKCEFQAAQKMRAHHKRLVSSNRSTKRLTCLIYTFRSRAATPRL